MGVTIHFEGKLKSHAEFDKVLSKAKSFAMESGFDFSIIEESERILHRVKEEQDWDYRGLTKGIKLFPDENADPLWLEFDEDLYVQEYCKTQFAGTDVHISIVKFLKEIKSSFVDLIVYDEGEYWETENRELLQQHLDNCFYAAEEAKAENSKLDGPFRLKDGRIIDLMESE